MKHQKINEKRLQFCKAQRFKYGEFTSIDCNIPNWVEHHIDVNIQEYVQFYDTGFNYVWNGFEYVHTPHSGKIIIEKDVVIHSGVNIVRGTGDNDVTVIGEGSKLDFSVHVAHNVKIGKHCLIVSHANIGGSTVIGDNCYIGMSAVIRNKLKIGNNVTIGMGAVVICDIPDGETWVGNPAKKLIKLTKKDMLIRIKRDPKTKLSVK